jgi:uncharacterized repeat protein (TIGR02543 family)
MKKKNEQSAVGKTGSRRKTALVLFTAAFMVTAMAALVVSFAPADNDDAGDQALGAYSSTEVDDLIKGPGALPERNIDAFLESTGATHELYGDIVETFDTNTYIITRAISGLAVLVDGHGDYAIIAEGSMILFTDISAGMGGYSSPYNMVFVGEGKLTVYGDLDLDTSVLKDGSKIEVNGVILEAESGDVEFKLEIIDDEFDSFKVEDGKMTVSFEGIKGYVDDDWDLTSSDLITNFDGAPITYNITYKLNGGSVAAGNPTTYDVDDLEITPIILPTKAGYTGAWSPAFIIPGTGAGEVFGDFEFVAVYTKVPYDITYDLNDSASYPADANPNAGKTSFDVEERVVLIDPTRDGYTFAGWELWTNSGPFGFVLDGITSVIEPGAVVYDVEFVATWNPIEYALWYVMNDSGSVSAATNNAANGFWYSPDDMVTFGDPTRAGYTFLGWSLVNEAIAWDEGEGEYGWDDSGTFVLFVPVEDTDEWIGNQVLYAIWEVIEYAITYDTIGTELNPETYTIEDYVVLVASTKTGYVFGGWFTSSAHTSAVSVPAIVPGTTGPQSFFAKLDAIECFVFIDDAYFNAAFTAPIFYDDLAGLVITVTTKTHYDFAGIFSVSMNNVALDIGDHYTVTGADENVITLLLAINGDIKIVAEYDLTEYDIDYTTAGVFIDDPNDGSFVTYTIETKDVLPTDATRAGYDFAGWTRNGSPISAIFPGDADKFGGDIILVATWTPKTYNITYNDALGETPNDTYSVLTGKELPYDFDVNGYTFVGWYNNANLIWGEDGDGEIGFGQWIEGQNGLEFILVDWITEIEQGDMGDQAFWSYWMANTVEISFDIEGFDGVASFLYLITLAEGIGYEEGVIVGEWTLVNSDEVIDAPYGASIIIMSISEGRYTFGWTGVSTGDTTPVPMPFNPTGIGISFDLNGQGLDDVGVVVAGEYEFIFGYSYAWAIVILAVISVMVVFVAMSIFGRK